MNSFQKITLTVASVILILTLIILGVIIYNSRNSELFPPVLGNCPDYFEMRQKQGLDTCYNVHHLGNGNRRQCEWFIPSDNIKAKKDFVKKCGLTWDGLEQL